MTETTSPGPSGASFDPPAASHDGPAPVREQIDRLLARYGLTPQAGEQLLRLVDLVSVDPRAPTTVRDPLRVVDDHVADSLVALELTEVRDASTIVDLGTGPGFPGLPLAVALPGAEVALVDGNSRKCAFVERAIAVLGIPNARAFHARAESWPDGLLSFELATARALAPLDVVAEWAAPLLAVGGTLVVWRGRRDPPAEAAGATAAMQLGLEVHQPLPVVPYPGAEHRHLHLMSKVTETPRGFPRRPGMARKRPLGGGGATSDRARR